MLYHPGSGRFKPIIKFGSIEIEAPVCVFHIPFSTKKLSDRVAITERSNRACRKSQTEKDQSEPSCDKRESNLLQFGYAPLFAFPHKGRIEQALTVFAPATDFFCREAWVALYSK
jgi:hypothetical protein